MKKEGDDDDEKTEVKKAIKGPWTADRRPPEWEKVWELVTEMRGQTEAPVDTEGCERLAERGAVSEKAFRFQTLVALMLSSQTKDTITAAAVRRLQAHCRTLSGGGGALSVGAMLLLSEEEVKRLITGVGFHNRKAQYLLRTAALLRERHDDDIPSSVAGLCQLPGVGPKMAHLAMQAAWGVTEGIGVDVHVHRITNRLGWVRTSTPEDSRVALERWLPQSHWRPINALLVGFGQTVCSAPKPKCADCLLAHGLCPSSSIRAPRPTH